MDNWFTIDKTDSNTYIISEYRHWEETHCYLLNGRERSLLIDTGLGISNIFDEVVNLRTSPLRQLQRIFIGIILEDTNIFRILRSCWRVGLAEWQVPLSIETIKEMVVDRCNLPDGFDVNDYEFFRGAVKGSDWSWYNWPWREAGWSVSYAGTFTWTFVFWEKDTGYLFTGDLVYKDILFAYYPSTDPEAYFNSLKDFFPAGKESISCPSFTGYTAGNLISYAKSIWTAWSRRKTSSWQRHI